MKQRRTFNLSEFIRGVRETDPGFDIALGDGMAPVFVPDPVLWSDEVMLEADRSPVKAARLLLGDDEYERYAAAGGSAVLMFKMIEENTQAPMGESSSSTD